ncbi:MAG: hypothetical protein HQ546_09285 [Planctomycetes bacterium]|nr:hypothetical protein [Planctomycetota bacterium]
MTDQFNPFQTGPLYERHKARWQLELDVSEFTLDVVQAGTYLEAFSDREHPDDYAYRTSMSCPLDMCRDGVRIRVDNLWRTLPKRRVYPGKYADLISQLLYDADGDGTSLDKFMQDACWDMYVTGTDIVTQVTSAPKLPVRTRADEQAAGIRPYFMRFSPMQRYDWAVNGSRNFVWARYCLGTEHPADERNADEVAVTQFLTLTTAEWRKWRVTRQSDAAGRILVELVDRGVNPLGRPPIIKLYYSESRKVGQGGVPLSLLTRPALVAKVAMNVKSQADADLLAAVTRWMLSGAAAEDLPETYAPGVVWKIPNPDARLQIAQGDVAHIQEKRQWLVLYLAEILRLLKFRGGMAEINASSGSGLKLAIERTDLDNELRSTAGQMEATEMEMIRQAVCLAKGVHIPPERAAEELKYDVSYNRDFILEPVGEMLDNIAKWISGCSIIAGDVKEISREMVRQLANMLMRDGTIPYKQALAEIDAASFTGAIGKPSAGPETTPT